jgi:hemerythrin-like domain-containing protein
MKPIGPLMREHRLIEKMVDVLDKKQAQMSKVQKVDVNFLMVAVDFFRMYADRTHHGKEEDILFKELANKQLTPELKQIMNELVEEHVWARKMVTTLVQARESYIQGNPQSLSEITDSVNKLVAFYPAHIMKEDKRFFYPILDYFTVEEQNAMLDKFWEFDRMLIHEKYQKILADLANS